ncbi:MAG: hypothetical protein QXY40_07425 [Candidatus Methanomethylicia archaeon]
MQIISRISITAFIEFMFLDLLHVLKAVKYRLTLSLHISLCIVSYCLSIDALFL